MLITSLKAVYHETRLFAEHFVPSILGLIVLVATWSMSRYFGRLYEQGQIKKYLPEIARKEVAERDAKIKELTALLVKERGEIARLRRFYGYTIARCGDIIDEAKSYEAAGRQ